MAGTEEIAAAEGDFITSTLIAEARGVGDQIAQIMRSDERLLATGSTVFVAVASIAVANGKAQVLMALPFSLSLLYCFISYQHAELMALGGYKQVLEEAIETRTGTPLLAWETVIAPALHRGRAVLAVRFLSLTFYSVSIFAGLYQAIETTKSHAIGHAHWWIYLPLTSLSIATGTVAIVISGRAASRQFELASNLARLKLLPKWTA